MNLLIKFNEEGEIETVTSVQQVFLDRESLALFLIYF